MATREELKAAAEAKAKAEAAETAELAAREKAEAEAKAQAEAEAKAKADADAQKKADADAAKEEAEAKAKAEAEKAASARGFRVQRIDRHDEVAFYCNRGPVPGWNADRDIAAVFSTRANAKKIADLHAGDGDITVEKID